eukprot:3535423-Pleurochrysis_carterae.AAC.1
MNDDSDKRVDPNGVVTTSAAEEHESVKELNELFVSQVQHYRLEWVLQLGRGLHNWVASKFAGAR